VRHGHSLQVMVGGSCGGVCGCRGFGWWVVGVGGGAREKGAAGALTAEWLV
jgi:hypothetical protein